MSGFRAELSSWQEQVRTRFAALVLHKATTSGEQKWHFSGPFSCPRGAAASPGVTGGLQWGFNQLRNEETSPFQMRLLHFSQQLTIVSLVFPGYLPAPCTSSHVFCGIFLNEVI